METIYTSFEAEALALSEPRDAQINTKTSKETQKALRAVRDFVSEKFSLLLQPKQSKRMKNYLDYLLSLTPKDGISLRMRSVISQISKSFSQWGMDYIDASFKLKNASSEISKYEDLKEGIKANVREFEEVEDLENGIRKRLEHLKKRKRKLEKEMNAVKAEIWDCTSAREDAVKRRREIWENGRKLRIKRDDLRIIAPQLRAEEEWAKIIQSNIEDQWSKLGTQFIQSSSFANLN